MVDISAHQPTFANGLFATMEARLARLVSPRSSTHPGAVATLALDARQRRDAGLPSGDHAERAIARMLRCGL